jgi:hypothetical protein
VGVEGEVTQGSSARLRADAALLGPGRERGPARRLSSRILGLEPRLSVMQRGWQTPALVNRGIQG